MYLVAVTIDAPGRRIAADVLRRALDDAVTAADRLEHVHLNLADDLVVFSLYLRASGPAEARGRAEQLCRRTMAAVSPPGGWRVLSARTMHGAG